VILSYRDKETEDFANRKRVKRFASFEGQGWKRLKMLNQATSTNDLMQMPSNRFEALSGDRHGQFSIRINQQRRICFEWTLGAPGPSKVEFVDDH
jgi:proteic killer suppression protein